MNSKLKIKRGAAKIVVLAIALSSFAPAFAADDEDNKGLWTSIELSKKVTKKFKIGAEAEFRSNDYLKEVERFSVGISGQYKINDWLKASAGHIFIFGYKPESTKIHFDENGDEDGYNCDQAYWEKRNRVHISLSGEYKIGRVQLSLRERLQYTRTHAEIIDEEKHRFTTQRNDAGEWVERWETPRTEPETKEHKNNTVLRSRLTAKWDIAKCKVSPFASTELYSRINGWDSFEKLRSRVGASYKIDKDNSVEVYYLFEKAGEKGKANTHAIGVGYSLDL